MTSILQDLLIDDLTEPQVRLQVNYVFESLIDQDAKRLGRSKTLGKAKSLLEFYDLVKRSVDDIEKRTGISDDKKVILTEEEPDISSKTETITFSVVKRMPGA